ncbi:MAG: NifU family protein [Armatimonadota bacterium]|nr:NifU family protein [Armatimonadota bacterium]
MNPSSQDLTTEASRIATLLGELESLPASTLRSKAEEILQGLLALYGEGLARMLEIVRQGRDPEAVERLLHVFTQDDLVSQLLLLHDLHPVDLETRVAQALNEVRPKVEAHGGSVDLLGVEGGVAQLRLKAGCSSCSSSAAALKETIEEAIYKAAPDLDGVILDAASEPVGKQQAFVPLSALLE